MLDKVTTDSRIAVVGGGVAGLGAAWLLSRHHRVSLFERNDYVGGHTNTVALENGGRPVAVDTGFIVYNEPNYPHLTALFAELGVQSRDSDMSFGVSVGGGDLEYAGSSLATLFAQPGNLMSPRFVGMLSDILRFNRVCKRRLAADDLAGVSVGGLLDDLGMGTAFRHHYLLPMAAAIWSCPVSQMLAFPAASLVGFFANHGLLNLRERPQWRTVVGGSRQYVEKMLPGISGDVHTRNPVRAIRRQGSGVELQLEDGRRAHFDQVVLACHADESLALLSDPSPTERTLLSAFRYQANRAVLHSDVTLMPRRRAVWSSWNYLAETAGERLGDPRVSVTYWMNRLQGLDTRQHYLVTLNPLREPDPRLVHATFAYQHPVFDANAMVAQRRLAQLQGRNNTWFCGSYFGFGFHEDALRSGVAVARSLGVDPGWDSAASTSGIDAPAVATTGS